MVKCQYTNVQEGFCTWSVKLGNIFSPIDSLIFHCTNFPSSAAQSFCLDVFFDWLADCCSAAVTNQSLLSPLVSWNSSGLLSLSRSWRLAWWYVLLFFSLLSTLNQLPSPYVTINSPTEVTHQSDGARQISPYGGTKCCPEEENMLSVLKKEKTQREEM